MALPIETRAPSSSGTTPRFPAPSTPAMESRASQTLLDESESVVDCRGLGARLAAVWSTLRTHARMHTLSNTHTHTQATKMSTIA